MLTKRLTQCLHPGLPSGVHLKTLEIYQTIFQVIGKEQLERDLIFYSYGLFPLLSVAALPVKPVLLDLYETYFLRIGRALEPVLIGFLIGLFSSLEEGVDFYDRIVNLVESLIHQVSAKIFYNCLWSSMEDSSSIRYAAMNFIRNHLNGPFPIESCSKSTMVRFDDRKEFTTEIVDSYLLRLSLLSIQDFGTLSLSRRKGKLFSSTVDLGFPHRLLSDAQKTFLVNGL